MKIKWLGHAMFEIADEKSGVKVITDPYSTEVGYPVKNRSCDVVTISHDHYDHNFSDVIDAELVLKGSVDTDFKGLKIKSILTFHDEAQGRKRGNNYMYRLEGDVNVIHMGDYGEDFLRPEVAEFLKSADILLIPVGGIFTIGPEKAAEVVKQISPKIAIPMHYKTPHLRFELSSLDEFLSAWGGNFDKIDGIFEIERAELPTKTRIVVLDYEV